MNIFKKTYLKSAENHLLSNQGVTLIEILIVVAISSIVGLAIMNLSSVLFKSVKSVSLSQEALNNYESISLALGANNCAINIDNPNFSLWESSPDAEIAINKISLFDQVILEVDKPLNGIVAKKLILTRVGGPSDIKINTSVTSGSAEINTLSRYHVRLSVTNSKQSLNGDRNLGGDEMKKKDFYFIADIYKDSIAATSLSVAGTKGQLFSCRGGQSIEFFKDICETGLGGIYDESKYPYCLLNRIVVHQSHDERDDILYGSPATNSGAPPSGVPAGSDKGPWLYAERAFLKRLSLGDWGAWPVTETYRSWLGMCKDVGCTHGGDLGLDYLHISGKTNIKWPSILPSTGGRVIGLHDHVTIPDVVGTLSVGTEEYKDSTLYIQDNRMPLASTSPFINQRLGGITLKAPNNQAVVLIAGAGEGGSDSSNSALYLADATNSNSWVMAHKKNKNFFFGKWKAGSLVEAFSIDDATMNITAIATITANSDIRLKTDIAPIANALEKILNVNGVSFHWLDKQKSQEKQIGLIAQNVERVFPELVVSNNNGFKSVAYQNLVAPIIEAIRELYQKFMQTNEQQDREIEKLKLENAILKQAICEGLPKLQFCHINN